MRNQNRITPAQARQLMQQRAILWDVRTPAEYAAGHIPSARNVPLDRLEEDLPNLPSNGHPVIVCCRSGQRSAIAAELLAQAGYPDGFSMTITVPSNYTPHMNVAEVIVEQLSRVGITATINPVEWETWLSETYMGRDFESTVVGFDASNLSAGALLNRWVSTDGNNMINYNNPEYDSLMAQAAATTDDAQQTDLYKQAAALLSETAANVYIQDLPDFVLLKSNLEGYQFYPLYVMDLSTVHYVQ